MACKKLDIGPNEQRELVKQFLLKEAKMLSRLHHPNIIQLFGVCISERSLALLMEFAEKGTLRDELDREIKVPSGLQKILKAVPRRSARHNSDDDVALVAAPVLGELAAWRKFEILYQIALAMKTVHEMGALHQDIKPTNCMVVQVLNCSQLL